MKKWKIIKIVTILILAIALVRLIADMIVCINMSYPHPMLGIDAYSWIDQFEVDCVFFFIAWGIPILIDIILLIVSIKKLKSLKNNN